MIRRSVATTVSKTALKGISVKPCVAAIGNVLTVSGKIRNLDTR